MKSNVSENIPAQQKGYTLVELAIAVAILAVLIVAGLTGVQSILTSGKVNEQIKVAAKLNAKISSLYSSNVSGTQALTVANGTKEVANLGGWDAGRVSSTGTVTSAFGTTETVQTNTFVISDVGTNKGVVYNITSVPKDGCADLANGLNGLVHSMVVVAASSAAPTTEAIWKGTTAVKTPGNSSLATSTLATQCALANTLDFWILLKP